MNLQDVLETFKMQGHYAVSLYYGEDIGCDDLDVPQEERTIRIVMTPVGSLGEARKMLVTNLKELASFDFETTPNVVNNPPSNEEIRENGFYLWGTTNVIEKLRV